MPAGYRKTSKSGMLFDIRWANGGFGRARANLFRGYSEASQFHFQNGNTPDAAGT